MKEYDVANAAGEEMIRLIRSAGLTANWEGNGIVGTIKMYDKYYQIHFHSGTLVELDIGFYSEHDEVDMFGKNHSISYFKSIDDTSFDLADPAVFDKIVEKLLKSR